MMTEDQKLRQLRHDDIRKRARADVEWIFSRPDVCRMDGLHVGSLKEALIGRIAVLLDAIEAKAAENGRLREVVVELREALETKSEATARAALARVKEMGVVE